MKDSEIKVMINKIFEEEFELESNQIKDDALIFQDLGLDSLDIIDLVVALEKSFGVKVRSRESLSTIRTVNDIYEFVIKEQQKINDN